MLAMSVASSVLLLHVQLPAPPEYAYDFKSNITKNETTEHEYGNESILADLVNGVKVMHLRVC